MSVEIDAFEGFDNYCFSPLTPPLENFHEVFGSQSCHGWRPSNRIDVETRTKTSFSNAMRPSERTGGSVSGGLEYRWGDKDEKGFSAWAKAEVHDNKGNKLEAKAEKKNDGSGSINLSGSHEYQETDRYGDHNNQDRG